MLEPGTSVRRPDGEIGEVAEQCDVCSFGVKEPKYRCLWGMTREAWCFPESKLIVVPADVVKSPSHYIAGKYECRDVITALDLNWGKGNAFAYLWRAGRKAGVDEVTDLRKAIECLEHEVKRLTGDQ